MSTTDATLHDSPLTRIAQASWKWVLALGIVQLIFGIVAVAWPGLTVSVLGTILGIYLLLSGIVIFISAFSPGLSSINRALLIVTGAISVPLGLSCLRDELRSIAFLGIWVGVAWIMSGISRLVSSIGAPAGVPGRGLIGVSGAITLIAGIVMMTWPISSILTLAWVSGVFLILAGIAYIIESLAIRKASSPA